MELGKGCYVRTIWPLMLPMTLQFIIVMIATAINDRLQRKLDYVDEERRILREQLDAGRGGKKIVFTAEQRRRLASAGKLLTPDERRKCCCLVRPATVSAIFGTSSRSSWPTTIVSAFIRDSVGN